MRCDFCHLFVPRLHSAHLNGHCLLLSSAPSAAALCDDPLQLHGVAVADPLGAGCMYYAS